MSTQGYPIHTVIIPDGNRRWAKAHNLPSLKGHSEGYKRTKEIIEEAKKLNLSFLTFWAFSSENWSRSKEEVDDLLSLIYKGLHDLSSHVESEKIKFLHLGRKDRLSKELSSLIESLEKSTEGCTGLCLTLAIDYGGRDELARAEKLLLESKDSSKSLEDFLDTAKLGLPNPDFIIRTSGEQRTSGFMPLQSAYSEWLFIETLFPDFDATSFGSAVNSYVQRSRRFGK
jgi:undecaprenyl diphosphate synthase